MLFKSESSSSCPIHPPFPSKLSGVSASVGLLLLIRISTCYGQVKLTPSLNYMEVYLVPNQVAQVTLSEVPAGTGYVIIQAHGYLRNVTLSTGQTLTPGQFTVGYDVGVVVTPPANSAYVQNHHENVTVPVLLIAMFYDTNAPIPGGCNMELSMKTAPFLPTTFSMGVLTVEYPLGSWPLNVKPATCDRAPLQYDVYELYLEERDFSNRTAFDSIRLMSSLTSIEQSGRKVEFSGSPPSKVKFANYPGTGRGIAVNLRTLTSSAAYTPTMSYGCYPESPDDDDESCQALTSSVGVKLLNAVLLFIGLFLILLGHRFYKCQLFLLGFCMSAVLFYILLERVISVGSTGLLWFYTVAGTSSTTVGALGGALWLALWSKFGSPMAPVLLAALLLGSLLASVVAYTPLGDMAVLKDDLTFWLAYICVTLAVPLSIISFAQLTSIFVSSEFGAYLFILPIDNYLGSNVKYIALNVIRRATVPDFRTTILDPPFQTKYIILVIVWATLSVVGVVFQLWRERGRAPFPPPPPSSQPYYHQQYQELPSTSSYSSSSGPAPIITSLYGRGSSQNEDVYGGGKRTGAGLVTTTTSAQEATETSPLLLSS